MKVIIEDAVVQKNIQLLKRVIEKHLHPEKGKAPPSLSEFAAYINCLTGEILFAEDLADAKAVKDKKWRSICLRIRLDVKPEESGFEVLEEETNEVLFQCDKMDPKARRILGVMIATLNRVMELQTTQEPQVARILEDVTHLEITSTKPSERKGDIVHDAWHQVDRARAEELLLNEALGTFFFRKDRYAEMIEEQLSLRFRTPVRCITLTYLASDDQVVDLTLVRKGEKWYIYEDDPTLNNSSYSSIPNLLSSLNKILFKPYLF